MSDFAEAFVHAVALLILIGVITGISIICGKIHEFDVAR